MGREPSLFVLVLRSLFRLEITAGWAWIAGFILLCLKAAGVL